MGIANSREATIVFFRFLHSSFPGPDAQLEKNRTMKKGEYYAFRPHEQRGLAAIVPGGLESATPAYTTSMTLPTGAWRFSFFGASGHFMLGGQVIGQACERSPRRLGHIKHKQG